MLDVAVKKENKKLAVEEAGTPVGEPAGARMDLLYRQVRFTGSKGVAGSRLKPYIHRGRT
jgi:hypothetical protein